VDAVAAPGIVRGRLALSLARRFEADRVALTGSGTQALQLALAQVGSPESSPPLVALPAYTCFDVATAAVASRVRVTFYDLDPVSLTPDAQGVRAALAAGAQALVANSLFGFPLDWGWLRAECEGAGALLIEDAAQGIGTEWDGKPGGSFGDLTVLSFGRGKGWTGGSGGALLVRGRASGEAGEISLDSKLLAPRAAARAKGAVALLGQWALGRPALFGIPAAIPGLGLGETHYRSPTPTMRITALAAATVLRHEEEATAEVDRRRTTAERWAATFAALPTMGDTPRLCRPIDPEGCSYLRLPMRASGASAEACVGLDALRAGIAQAYPRALTELAPLAPLVVGPGRPARGAEELARRLFTLPTHSHVTQADLRFGAKLLATTETISPPR
jgi:dTDP-4-amino-4,6-dideoxygalactose transaminase